MFVSIMSRVEGREHDSLLSTYGFRGFPSFGILDAEGKLVGKPMGRSVEAFQSALDDIARVAKVRALAASGDPEAVAELEKIEKAQVLKDMLGKINQRNAKEIASDLYAKYKAGHKLIGKDATGQYYLIILQGAILAKDLAGFDEIRPLLEAAAEKDRMLKMQLSRFPLDQVRQQLVGEGMPTPGN